MFTNLHNIPLPVQVWLAADEYNAHKEITKYLSATTILRPLKSVILGRRVDPNTVAKDVTDFIAVRRGTAIHDSIEKVWNDAELRASAMRKLGYPDKVIEMYKVNDPTPIDQRLPKTRYVDMEQRAFKKIGDWTIGGQFDFICDGMLFDFKTTSTYAKMNNGHDRDYCIQGSIYRWLNPELIKGDFLTICFIYSDWTRAKAEQDKDYPQVGAGFKQIPLMSIQETEQYIWNKIQKYEKFLNSPEEELPECTSDELWQMPSSFKVFSKPDAVRALRVFETEPEAYAYLATIDRKKYPSAFVKEIPGYVKRCFYCPALPLCKQRMKYKVKGIDC